MKMIYGTGNLEGPDPERRGAEEDRRRFCLAEEEVLTLADRRMAIEEHYTRRRAGTRPWIIEWAKERRFPGRSSLSRPPRNRAVQKRMEFLETYRLEGRDRSWPGA